MIKTEIEDSFPSSIDLIAASALLTLSSLPPKHEIENFVTPPSCSSSRISISKSNGESSTMDTCGDTSRPLHLTVVAYLSEARDLKFKIVRKKRSKCIPISKSKKIKSELAPSDVHATSETASEITTADTSSCISNSRSSSSSTQSCRKMPDAADKLRNNVSLSGSLGNKAAAIRNVLAHGSASEMRIRQLLGDSPSTSKALRLLLRLEEVKRSGAGGRGDPYIYMMAS